MTMTSGQVLQVSFNIRALLPFPHEVGSTVMPKVIWPQGNRARGVLTAREAVAHCKHALVLAATGDSAKFQKDKRKGGLRKMLP